MPASANQRPEEANATDFPALLLRLNRPLRLPHRSSEVSQIQPILEMPADSK
jgi:hypothetical protein